MLETSYEVMRRQGITRRSFVKFCSLTAASLGLGEAIAVGEGVPMPTRIRFDALPSDAVPRSITACFTDGWSVEIEDNSFIDRIVEQWRAQRMLAPDID